MRFQKLSILIMNIMKHAAILIKVDMKWIWKELLINYSIFIQVLNLLFTHIL